MNSKIRRFFARAIAIVVSITIVWLVMATHSPGYRSDAVVATTSYTNVFFTRAFEDHIIQTVPGVLRLRVRPDFGPIPSTGGPRPTNGVLIGITAVGETAEDARRVADEVAMEVCASIQTSYGIRGMLVVPAGDGQRVSYFNDTLQPAVVRLFDK